MFSDRFGSSSTESFLLASPYNENSSAYLSENADEVNRLEDEGCEKEGGNISSIAGGPGSNGWRSASKNSNLNTSTIFSPSPLVHDLKSLSMEFEDEEVKSVSSLSKGAILNNKAGNILRKRAATTSHLDSVKSSNLFEGEANGSLQKEKKRIREQLHSGIIEGREAAVARKNQPPLHPRESNISSAILSNASVMNEIQGCLAKQSLVSHHSDRDQGYSSKDRNEQKEARGNPSSSLMKKTPVRAKNTAIDEESKNVEELQRVLRRIQLNSYEKKVIYDVLTPGKRR